MKIATNLEQSEKLAKFVPLYTADMRLDEFNTPYPFPWKFYSGIGSAIIKPSWSLAVLVKMLPSRIYYEPKGWEDEELDMKLDFGKKSDDEYYICYRDIFTEIVHDELIFIGNDFVDVCVDMIVKLKEMYLL